MERMGRRNAGLRPGHDSRGGRPVKGYLDELTDRAAAPVIAKYTGGWPQRAWSVFITTLAILQSIRLDLGPSSPVHP